MSFRPTLTILAGVSAILTFSACKTVYSDTFAYKKTAFRAPAESVPKIDVTPTDIPTDPAMDGGLIPDAAPGEPMPDAGGIPGIPGVPPAPDAAPAIPGL